MKTTIHKFSRKVAFLGMLLATAAVANVALAQTSSTTTTTTTSAGTVRELSPDTFTITSDTSTTPVRYTYSKTTTYVDENGNPVSVETVRTGVPVTVYYEKEGDNFVADKVVVRKTVTTTDTPAPTTTVTTVPATTTTTVSQPLPMPPKADGVVTDAGSGHIDLRTSTSPKPIHYKAHDATAYVDEGGNPIPRKVLTPGTPVTIFYEQDGDDLLATRVIVRNSALLER